MNIDYNWQATLVTITWETKPNTGGALVSTWLENMAVADIVNWDLKVYDPSFL